MNDFLPKELNNKIKNFIKKHELNGLTKDLENKKVIEFLSLFFQTFAEIFFSDKEHTIFLFDILKYSILNFDKILLKSNLVDKELYKAVKDKINIALGKDREKLFEIYLAYKKSFKSKFPIEKIPESLLIYNKFGPKVLELAKKATFKKFFKEISSMFLNMIEENREEEFQLYFFDWVLKFGYIIEGYVKDILFTELRLDCLLNKRDFNKIAKKNNTIGKLLRTLEADQTLAKYRNAIFHTTFIINYKLNLKDRKIIFIDENGIEEEMGILEFINLFFKLIQLVQTYRFAFTYSIPQDMRIDGQKQLLEMLEEFKKELESVNNWSSKN